ncbi:MAG: tyrosine-type recombinase/integrase [Nitrososphaerales archaeon]
MRGVYKRPVKITFGEFGERYMVHAKLNKRSWLRDEQMLGNLKDFFGSERQLTEIIAADIEGYKLHRRSFVSGSTVNRELALLKRMFNLAIEWDLYLGLNPFRKVKFFREFNTGLRVLNPEEEEALLGNAAPYLQDLIRFALNTGLRVGEIFSLRWANVDWEKNILNVFAPKTQKIRAIPINADARKVLDCWALGKRSEFVFYNPESGKPFVDLKNGFVRACRKAGISGVTWHTLRHTFASRLVGRGVDIVTVKELLGHSSVTVTMRYTHTNIDAKRAAVEKLLHNECDKSVTVCSNLHQPKSALSQNRVISYNAART